MKLYILNQLCSFYLNLENPQTDCRLSSTEPLMLHVCIDSVQDLHKLSGYLKVFDVGEGNSDGDHGPGIVVGEVQPFTHLSSAHSDQQSAVCNEDRMTHVSLTSGCFQGQWSEC